MKYIQLCVLCWVGAIMTMVIDSSNLFRPTYREQHGMLIPRGDSAASNRIREGGTEIFHCTQGGMDMHLAHPIAHKCQGGSIPPLNMDAITKNSAGYQLSLNINKYLALDILSYI